MALKWVNIIEVTFVSNEKRYVTGFGERKVVFWKDGEQAMPLELWHAKDVVFGLLVNGYYAHIITTPECCLENYKNQEAETENKTEE